MAGDGAVDHGLLDSGALGDRLWAGGDWEEPRGPNSEGAGANPPAVGCERDGGHDRDPLALPEAIPAYSSWLVCCEAPAPQELAPPGPGCSCDLPPR